MGALAIIVGLCVLLWLPDSPVHARILTKEERIAALERVRNDQGGTANRNWKKDQIIEAVTDIRSWLIVLSTLLSLFCFVVVNSGLRLTLYTMDLQQAFQTEVSATVSPSCMPAEDKIRVRLQSAISSSKASDTRM